MNGFLEYGFLVNSLVMGSFVAIIGPLIGSFLVVKRLSALTDTLSHTSLVGIIISILININPIVGAIISAVTTSLVIDSFQKAQKYYSESLLILFMTGGLGLSTLLISLNKDRSINISKYLFGNINLVNSQDIFVFGIVGIVVILLVNFFWKSFYIIALDEELAISQGIKVRIFDKLFLAMSSFVIAMSIQSIGVLMISSLMIVPVISAMRLDLSFQKTVMVSIIFGLLAVWSGILLSYQFDIATTGLIVTINATIYVMTSIFVFSKSKLQ